MKRRKKSGVQLFGIFTERKEGGKKENERGRMEAIGLQVAKGGSPSTLTFCFQLLSGSSSSSEQKRFFYARIVCIYIYVCM